MPDILSETMAIIADDEANAMEQMKSRILSAWPDLNICGEAVNGVEAKQMIETLHPDVAFLDIRMPGLSGIQVAHETAGSCRIVFITAHDQYAIDAFENAAIDYILKPVTVDRLEKTVQRIKAQIAVAAPIMDMSVIIEKLRSEIEKGNGREYLRWIKAKVNTAVRLIPVEEIYFFKASNRYTIVMTRIKEYLIKKSITELTDELDPDVFFRIHRGTIVNAHYINKISTSPTGRGQIRMKDRPEIFTVSRSYVHVFKQM